MWKNVLEPHRPHNGTTRRMRFLWLITKATDAHSEYIIVMAFPRQRWLRERASVFYININIYIYIYIVFFFTEIIVGPEYFNIMIWGGGFPACCTE